MGRTDITSGILRLGFGISSDICTQAPAATNAYSPFPIPRSHAGPGAQPLLGWYSTRLLGRYVPLPITRQTIMTRKNPRMDRNMELWVIVSTRCWGIMKIGSTINVSFLLPLP